MNDLREILGKEPECSLSGDLRSEESTGCVGDRPASHLLRDPASRADREAKRGSPGSVRLLAGPSRGTQ